MFHYTFSGLCMKLANIPTLFVGTVHVQRRILVFDMKHTDHLTAYNGSQTSLSFLSCFEASFQFLEAVRLLSW